MASTWLDGFGDWAWPGPRPAVEIGPAAWVPSTPLMAVEASALPARVARPRSSSLRRPLRLARLLLLLVVAGATFALSSRFVFAHSVPPPPTALTSLRLPATLSNPFATTPAPPEHLTASAPPAAPLPVPVALRRYSAGGEIAQLTFASAALRRRDSFLVYLPPRYASSTTRRYPVIYLLHGDQQPASSFLRLGVPQTLDALIAGHAIQPVIAVMLQGSGAPSDWENNWAGNYYSYTGEVQRLVDRVLRTVPNRSARAIAGYSMGGFGAMNIALSQLENYSVVESWEGQFANLTPTLAADSRLLRRLPLKAFVWGGAQDRVVDSSLDAPWAAALRAAGASARSAVYPGAHAFAPIERHLRQMLSFAARALRS